MYKFSYCRCKLVLSISRTLNPNQNWTNKSEKTLEIHKCKLINRVTLKGSHQISCITQRSGNGGKGNAPAETCLLIKFQNYFGYICYSYSKLSEFKLHKGNLTDLDVTPETSKNAPQVFSHYWHVVLSLEKIK